ncbi:MAG: hypothetical protein WC333_01190 [Dehalococcoidia bacterium]|jgi:hypothetical protein
MIKEEKDYEAVNEYFEKYSPKEYETVRVLNLMMKRYYPNFVSAGVSFRGQPPENRFDRFDCKLIWINEKNEEILLALGELEYGADQMRFDEDWKNWNNAFPVNHWYCVSLLSRKKYDENFVFFLKVSPSFKSAFVVDTRNDFVSKNMDKEYEMPRDSTNDRFPTNKMRKHFNWETVRKNQMIFKRVTNKNGNIDITIEKDGNFCLMEYEYWYEIIAFFAYKYFPDELKKIL